MEAEAAMGPPGVIVQGKLERDWSSVATAVCSARSSARGTVVGRTGGEGGG